MSNENLELNKEYANVFEENIKLTCSPVAIKLLKSEDEVPEGIERIGEKIRHCEMVRKASYGDTFYSTIDEHLCQGGAGAIGLREMPPKVASGEHYFNLGRFKTPEIAKSTTDALSVISEPQWGIAYAPLNEANFEPDVVIIISEPITAMKIAQTIVYNNGEKVRPNFAGIQSLCGDALANPYLEKSVNITMGCDGSRKAADIKDNELAIGISKDRLEEVIESLKAI